MFFFSFSELVTECNYIANCLDPNQQILGLFEETLALSGVENSERRE